MTKALIAGGGIAGPVTAMALQRAGVEAVVYEAHRPGVDDAGSYLTVAALEARPARASCSSSSARRSLGLVMRPSIAYI